ncbi:hypothetical protein HDU93_001204 [Gonapodya sp. JEL0774]|nr:hypothetical protein HDU93_001204 [Gonapodya sp. JEL0774]
MSSPVESTPIESTAMNVQVPTAADDRPSQQTPVPKVVKGRNVSGKPWLPLPQAVWRRLFTALGFLRDDGYCSWSVRVEARKQSSILKTVADEIKRQKDAAKEAAKKRRAEAIKKKEENEKKAEVVQTISAAKVKRMKKKELRRVKKA